MYHVLNMHTCLTATALDSIGLDSDSDYSGYHISLEQWFSTRVHFALWETFGQVSGHISWSRLGSGYGG